MSWHWYVRRGNELLLDLDSERALHYARVQLKANEKWLRVREKPYLERSGTPGHYHMILTLEKPMQPIQAAVWEMHLGGDRIRAQHNLMRISRGVNGTAGFLIADREYPGFRPPDNYCGCSEKHKERRVTSRCPVLRELLGREASAQYFAIRRKVKLPVGRVSLAKLLKV